MNKKELTTAVADAMGSTKKEAALAIESVINCIADAMAAGSNVSIVGFGTFEVVKRGARTCRNMVTGEMMDVAEKMAPKWRASKALKEAVSQLDVAGTEEVGAEDGQTGTVAE